MSHAPKPSRVIACPISAPSSSQRRVNRPGVKELRPTTHGRGLQDEFGGLGRFESQERSRGRRFDGLVAEPPDAPLCEAAPSGQGRRQRWADQAGRQK